MIISKFFKAANAYSVSHQYGRLKSDIKRLRNFQLEQGTIIQISLSNQSNNDFDKYIDSNNKSDKNTNKVVAEFDRKKLIQIISSNALFSKTSFQ